MEKSLSEVKKRYERKSDPQTANIAQRRLVHRVGIDETSEESSKSKPASNGLRGLIMRHPLFAFFLMAYAISWTFLSAMVLSVWGFLPNDFSLIAVVNIFASFGPTFAAIIVTSIVEGRAGLHSLRQRIRQSRVGWPWYLFILVGIPTLILLGFGIQPGQLAGLQGLTTEALILYPAYFFATWFAGGPLGEEIGWRGFALPRMQKHYGPLWGTMLLGTLWCLWHLPRFLTPYEGGGPGTDLATFITNFPIFFLTILALAIVTTWVFNHTRGSIFISITTHASFNTLFVLLPLFIVATYTSLFLAGAIGLGVTALLVVILTRGQLGYRLYAQKLIVS
jgi:membrane protease YdiL (CAAX protease family)